MRETWPRVVRLSPRVLVVTLDPWQQDNVVVIATRRGLVVVDADTSQSYARQIRNIARAEFGREDFVYVINTHDDWDHTGGNQAFADGAIVGHEKCAAILNRQRANQREEIAKEQTWATDQIAAARTRLAGADPKSEAAARDGYALARLQRYLDDLRDGFAITPPTMTFSDRLGLDLGDVTARLVYVGRAHKEGDTLVLVPEERLLVIGDLAFDDSIATQTSGGRYEDPLDVPRWLEALRDVLDNAVIDHVVKGHRSVESGEWLFDRRKYLTDLWDGVQAARAQRLALAQAVDRLSVDRFSYIKSWDPALAASALADRHAKMIGVLWNQPTRGRLPAR